MKVGSRSFYTGQTNEKILFTVQNIESWRCNRWEKKQKNEKGHRKTKKWI